MVTYNVYSRGRGQKTWHKIFSCTDDCTGKRELERIYEHESSLNDIKIVQGRKIHILKLGDDLYTTDCTECLGCSKKSRRIDYCAAANICYGNNYESKKQEELKEMAKYGSKQD